MKKRLIRKGWCFAIILFFVGASIIPLTGISIEIRKTSKVTTLNSCDLIVDDDFNESTPGWGITHFNRIQDAVDEAQEGWKICVYDGTYDEGVVITKKLTLEGNRTVEDDGSIINGESVGFIILGNNAKETEIRGFTIINSAIAGILILDSENIKIEHNTIKLTKYGIKSYSCIGDNFAIIENLIIENTYGIYMESSIKCEIRGNHIKNSKHGIDLLECENFFIYSNHLEDIPMWDIYIKDSGNEKAMEIRGNNIINNSGDLKFDITWVDSKNEWTDNYWSDYKGFGPYRIWGWIHIGPLPLLWFQVDDDPSEIIHDIPVP